MRSRVVTVGALIAMALGLAAAAPQGVTRFSGAEADGPLPEGWRHLELQRVERATRWRLVEDHGTVVLSGSSEAGASLVYAAVDLDPLSNPVVRWRWKVAATVAEADLDKCRRDDAAARVFVAFRWDPSLEGPWRRLVGPWQRLKYRIGRAKFGEMPPFGALVYTWAHREPVGWTAPNSRFERAVQVVLRSSDDPVGQWVEESRDVVADFRDWFGFDPPPISHVAFLVDADDTGGEARAWFGDLTFHQ